MCYFRRAAGRVMSPLDFEKMSQHSMDRGSRISYDRASKSSRGTSYKDMGGKRTPKGSASYKNMNNGGQAVRQQERKPSELTVSRLEQVKLFFSNSFYIAPQL